MPRGQDHRQAKLSFIAKEEDKMDEMDMSFNVEDAFHAVLGRLENATEDVGALREELKQLQRSIEGASLSAQHQGVPRDDLLEIVRLLVEASNHGKISMIKMVRQGLMRQLPNEHWGLVETKALVDSRWKEGLSEKAYGLEDEVAALRREKTGNEANKHFALSIEDVPSGRVKERPFKGTLEAARAFAAGMRRAMSKRSDTPSSGMSEEGPWCTDVLDALFSLAGNRGVRFVVRDMWTGDVVFMEDAPPVGASDDGFDDGGVYRPDIPSDAAIDRRQDPEEGGGVTDAMMDDAMVGIYRP